MNTGPRQLCCALSPAERLHGAPVKPYTRIAPNIIREFLSGLHSSPHKQSHGVLAAGWHGGSVRARHRTMRARAQHLTSIPHHGPHLYHERPEWPGVRCDAQAVPCVFPGSLALATRWRTSVGSRHVARPRALDAAPCCSVERPPLGLPGRLHRQRHGPA